MAQGSLTRLPGVLVQMDSARLFCLLVVSGPLHMITSAGWLNILHVNSGFQNTKMEPASLFKDWSQN